MRKLLLLFLLTFGLLDAQLYVGFSGFGKAQLASLQGISDLMESNTTSVTTETAFRGGGGLGVELGLNQYLGLQSGIWYMAEGGKAVVSYTGISKDDDEYFYDFSSIKIPLYLRVGEGIASQKVYFSAYMGPQFVFAGSRSVKVNGNEMNADSLINSFKSNYIEISGRIQIDIPVDKYSSISLALGGDYSVTNIYTPPANSANSDATINPLNFGFYFGFTRIIALKSMRKRWF